MSLEPDRASDPMTPIIPTDYGLRVIPDGRVAPRLMWPFRCALCNDVVVLDAYGGPYSCGAHPTMHFQPFLIPIEMVPKPELPSWWGKGVPGRFRNRQRGW